MEENPKSVKVLTLETPSILHSLLTEHFTISMTAPLFMLKSTFLTHSFLGLFMWSVHIENESTLSDQSESRIQQCCGLVVVNKTVKLHLT